MLRPGTPKEGKPRDIPAGESPTALAEPVKSYAEEAGLTMFRSPIIPYSLYALEATEYAKEKGLFEAFHRGVYKALWERTEDIGNLDVIKGVAQEAGLDWSELSPLLESSHYQERVIRQYQEAMDLGIEGIPGFNIGQYLFTGARPYEVFKSVVEKTLLENPSV